MNLNGIYIVFLTVLGFATYCCALENVVAPQDPKDAAPQLSADVDSVLTPETIAKLEKGEVVFVSRKEKDAEGRSRAQGRAIVLIRRPFDAIWDQLGRHGEFHEFFPHLVSSERYFENGNDIGLHETVKAFFMTFRYYVVHTRDKASGTIRWRLDRSKPSDIKDTNGSWVIRRHGENACIVIYSVAVDSGMSLPKKIEDFFQNKSLRDVVKALRKRMESPPS